MRDQRGRVLVPQAAAQERDLSTACAAQRGGQQPDAERVEPQLKLTGVEPGELTKLYSVTSLKLPAMTGIEPTQARRHGVLNPDGDVAPAGRPQRRQQRRALTS